MLPTHFPVRLRQAHQSILPVYAFITKYEKWLKTAGNDICDFALGNPQNMPLPGFVTALRKSVTPKDKNWYAYKMNEASSRDTVVNSLRQQFQRPYEAEDIFMTNGATGALMVMFNTLIGEGDEVILNSPPWFFYEGMILNTGGTPVRVNVSLDSFDLDLDAITNAITGKTRLIIVNSPNNPTGKIYPKETLQSLADILKDASKRHGRPIYLLSDEAYRKITYKGNTFTSPTSYYPYSFMVYTYGKTLLTPGQRIGYIALSPEMEARGKLREAIFSSQILCGWALTSAILQHSLCDLENLSIDMKELESKRDRLLFALRESGYQVHSPDGTFYLMPRSPVKDDVAFVDLLANSGVLCLPGSIVEMPGYFRISLTANVEMLEKSLPIFASARQSMIRIHG